jgi:hypothetical protein
MTVAVARDGWIAIFVALAVTQSVAVLPILCLAILPAWLVVTRSPQWLIRPRVSADGLSAPTLRPEA